jgi:hypothetical protein
MATRALIIGKSKDGQYHYGQTFFDGMDNLEWLQKNMNDVDKVEEFLHYMTEGCAEGGEGHGIRFLGYEKKKENDGLFGRIEYDYNKPKVEWYDEGYNCGIAKTKKAILEMKKQGYFDFPGYISYWDGKKWKNI